VHRPHGGGGRAGTGTDGHAQSVLPAPDRETPTVPLALADVSECYQFGRANPQHLRRLASPPAHAAAPRAPARAALAVGPIPTVRYSMPDGGTQGRRSIVQSSRSMNLAVMPVMPRRGRFWVANADQRSCARGSPTRARRAASSLSMRRKVVLMRSIVSGSSTIPSSVRLHASRRCCRFSRARAVG
jgi:hypothetical protein